jgi:hypothetical protein
LHAQAIGHCEEITNGGFVCTKTSSRKTCARDLLREALGRPKRVRFAGQIAAFQSISRYPEMI